MKRASEFTSITRGRYPAGLETAGAYNQLTLWSAANLAGMVTRMLVARKPFFQKLMSRLTGRQESIDRLAALAAPAPSPEESFPMLAEAIVGVDKSTIASVLGPPRSAVASGATNPADSTFWQANTWYYPVPRHGEMAMAINFQSDLASKVDFFQARAA